MCSSDLDFSIFVPMKKFYTLFVLMFAVATLHAQSVYFASKPSLSPDGTEIFFAWDGDIFRVPAEGGLALKIVSMKGTETAPLVSPDGTHPPGFCSQRTRRLQRICSAACRRRSSTIDVQRRV